MWAKAWWALLGSGKAACCPRHCNGLSKMRLQDEISQSVWFDRLREIHHDGPPCPWPGPRKDFRPGTPAWMILWYPLYPWPAQAIGEMAGNAMHSRAVGAALACILKAGVGVSILIAASASLLADTLIPNWAACDSQFTGWNFHCAFGGSQFTGWHSHQLAGSVGCLCQPVYWLTLWSGCSCLCQPVYWLALSSCGLCQPVYWLTHSHHAACVSQFTGWHFDRAAAACVSQFTGWHSHHAARVSQFTGWHFDHLGCNMLHVTNFAPNLSSCKRWLDIKQHQAVNIAKLDDFCQRAKVVWGLSELTRSWPHFFEFF